MIGFIRILVGLLLVQSTLLANDNNTPTIHHYNSESGFLIQRGTVESSFSPLPWFEERPNENSDATDEPYLGLALDGPLRKKSFEK